jgi:hypothetical protein
MKHNHGIENIKSKVNMRLVVVKHVTIRLKCGTDMGIKY